MDTFVASVAQFAITIGEIERNLASGRQAIQQAAEAGSQIIQLPELWISGYDLKNCEAHSHALIWYADEIQNLSNRHHMAIGGSYITSHAGRYFNSYLLFVPGSTKPVQYDKTHLFRLLDEDVYFTPGDSLTITNLGWGKTGLAVCYDMRFPELARAYAARGVDIMLVAAQWGSERTDHWRTLLRARAVENQIFIIAANATGPIHDKELAGYSVILDPWGNALAEAGANETIVLTAQLDLTELARVRQSVPSREDQRTDLYQQWADQIE